MSESKTSSSSGPRPGMKICPYCAEEIREAAVKCRFCHSYLTGSISEREAAEPEQPPEPEVAAPEDEEPQGRASSAPTAPVAKPGSKTVALPKVKPGPKPKPASASKTAKPTKATKAREGGVHARVVALSD